MTTDTNAGRAGGFVAADDSDGSWSGLPLEFSRIQGADCCGRIVAIGSSVDSSRIGERVLVRTIQITDPDIRAGTFVYRTIFPCAYSIAEGMLEQQDIIANKHTGKLVLVPPQDE